MESPAFPLPGSSKSARTYSFSTVYMCVMCNNYTHTFNPACIHVHLMTAYTHTSTRWRTATFVFGVSFCDLQGHVIWCTHDTGSISTYPWSTAHVHVRLCCALL